VDGDLAVRWGELADLGDSELRARLIQRGVDIDRAARLVNDRDRSADARAGIAEALS